MKSNRSLPITKWEMLLAETCHHLLHLHQEALQCQPLVTFLLLLVKLSKRYWSLGLSSCLLYSCAEMQQRVRRCQFLNHHWAQLKFVLLRSKCTLAGGQAVVKDKYVWTNLLVKQVIPQWFRQKLFRAPLLCFSTQVTPLSRSFSRQH